MSPELVPSRSGSSLIDLSGVRQCSQGRHPPSLAAEPSTDRYSLTSWVRMGVTLYPGVGTVIPDPLPPSDLTSGQAVALETVDDYNSRTGPWGFPNPIAHRISFCGTPEGRSGLESQDIGLILESQQSSRLPPSTPTYRTLPFVEIRVIGCTRF